MEPIIICGCDYYHEDSTVTYSDGESKGQCVRCGAKWYEHSIDNLPEDEKESAQRIQKDRGIFGESFIAKTPVNTKKKKAKYRIQKGMTWNNYCCSYCAGELVSLPPKYGKPQSTRMVVCPNCLARVVRELQEKAKNSLMLI